MNEMCAHCAAFLSITLISGRVCVCTNANILKYHGNQRRNNCASAQSIHNILINGWYKNATRKMESLMYAIRLRIRQGHSEGGEGGLRKRGWAARDFMQLHLTYVGVRWKHVYDKDTCRDRWWSWLNWNCCCCSHITDWVVWTEWFTGHCTTCMKSGCYGFHHWNMQINQLVCFKYVQVLDVCCCSSWLFGIFFTSTTLHPIHLL